MLWIDYNILNFINSTFPDKWNSDSNYFYKKWQPNRFIQFGTSLSDNRVHYEIVSTGIELHFEGENVDELFGNLIDFLMEQTDNATDYCWEKWACGWHRCIYCGEVSHDNIQEVILQFVAKFDELICAYSNEEKVVQQKFLSPVTSFDLDGKITLKQRQIGNILSLPLSIPDYQRAYCWEKENVNLLLHDIGHHIESDSKTPYRLGCVILHSHDGIFDIIDGQQRLITLALLCWELNIECPLHYAEFGDRESVEHIAYAKHLISQFSQKIKGNKSSFAEKLLERVELTMLILKDSSIDLAYTFFSNQNSRGVALTDYDLLKAHHLRYIPSSYEKQAYLAAETWNTMIENGYEKSLAKAPTDYEIVLDKYIYNLRKWLRYNSGGDDGTVHRIKNEYQAAPIIEELPPFGERFCYTEPIQGGQHFFAWVQKHVTEYTDFENLKVIKLLRHYLSWGSDNLYREAIEALAFAYFLKFGKPYIEEITVALLRIVAEHRYWNKRAIISSVLTHVVGLNVVQMIEQATSPTFVLAECFNLAKSLYYPKFKDLSPIQRRMRQNAKNISDRISAFITVDSFKQLNQ